eukprot:TRINITY_DN10529_c0_g1_i1.p1 TRINITY_DN10529_c0_g1~~TRINITY_DN10529_c0_g1_i1.p1  ORF type:complete len:134 (-),score=17.38 TRINITY_DN10529_c0_g1_i1:110-463(-)
MSAKKQQRKIQQITNRAGRYMTEVIDHQSKISQVTLKEVEGAVNALQSPYSVMDERPYIIDEESEVVQALNEDITITPNGPPRLSDVTLFNDDDGPTDDGVYSFGVRWFYWKKYKGN